MGSCKGGIMKQCVIRTFYYSRRDGILGSEKLEEKLENGWCVFMVNQNGECLEYILEKEEQIGSVL
jgi:hypothetical protein